MKWKLVPEEATQEIVRAVISEKRNWYLAELYAAMIAAAPEPEPCVWKETSSGSGWFTATCCEIQIKIPYAGIYCCYCGHPLRVVGHE